MHSPFVLCSKAKGRFLKIFIMKLMEFSDLFTNIRGAVMDKKYVMENRNTYNPEINVQDIVILVSDPTVKGMVASVEEKGTDVKYQVFVDGKIRTFYSGQIMPVDRTPTYHWVEAAEFRSILSAYQINHPSSANLYSLNSARIDFVPYQFRPALKLIKADEPRILIADSVGVGKTIEAGLIIKELEARRELENVMIICPKPLVTERKWELEMKRFDEEFIPLDGGELRRIISDTDLDGEWPARFTKTIVPYSILDRRVYHGEDGKYGKSIGLQELDPAPHFDLVIVDEAHHLRNGSMDKEKAFAYKCVKYFCDHADAVVMLTATPLQTGDDDLYTLLNLLRPDLIISRETFHFMGEPNTYISRCARIVRSADANWQSNALAELKKVQSTRWGETVIIPNPVYQEVITQLCKSDMTREERVALVTDIESLHSFHSILNRTRRKDIQDFCVRRSYTVETSFTNAQKKIHDELLRFEFMALSTLHQVRSVPFMMSTLRRQAASCIFGLAPYIRDIIERRFEQMADDPEIDLEQTELYDKIANPLASLAEYVLELADALPEEDPKFERVLEVVREKQKCDNNKIILFSTFRHTLAYVKKRLTDCGYRVAQIDGSVKDEIRRSCRERFELDRRDENALDILLFTEVGSEGLDYQFCDTMINYDLPWNPMRIEQRIGRIDRRGQVSEAVNIYNVITSGTVDADIYYRCLMRIGIFEKSIGECDEILGEISTEIEKIAADTMMTEEERRIKLEQMADNEIRKLQELSKLEDEQRELFGFDLSNYTTAQEIRAAESPWLMPEQLESLVRQYLQRRLERGYSILGECALKTLRLSVEAREKLREDFAKLSMSRSTLMQSWNNYLKGKSPTRAITFDSDAAAKNRDAFFITPAHPLVRQAAQFFAANDSVYVNLQCISDKIPSGTYPFSVYAWSYEGVTPKFRLIAVCENQAIIEHWQELIVSAKSVPADKTVKKLWKSLEDINIAMWKDEKEKHLEQVHHLAEYKLQSLKNSYEIRKNNLERLIENAENINIQKMRQGELDTATERFVARSSEIDTRKRRADIHTTLIANGIMTIGGK